MEENSSFSNLYVTFVVLCFGIYFPMTDTLSLNDIMKGINAFNNKNIKRIIQPYLSNEDANVIDGSGSVESQTDPISTIQDLVLTLQTEMKTGITMMNYKFDDLSKNVKALKLKLDTMRANSMKRIGGLDKSMMDVLETPVLKQQETNGAVHLCPINMFKNKGLVNTKYNIHDCADLRRLYGEEKSGFYRITTWRKTVHTVYCDMETDNGGWMVFQRRYDGSENFFRGWNDYKHGFGDYSGEFWLGNQVLYEVTSSFPHFELRIEMEDFGGEKRFAKFSEFSVNSEADRYLLRIGTYSGDAGNSLSPVHNGMQFTTKDNDRDLDPNGNCAKKWQGAWWFQDCMESHLNGKYFNLNDTNNAWEGIIWHTWKGKKYSLRSTKMMLRRVF